MSDVPLYTFHNFEGVFELKRVSEGNRDSGGAYRGASLTRKRNPLGPHRLSLPRILAGSYGGGGFL